MKYSIIILIIISFVLTSFESKENIEKPYTNVQESETVIASIEIVANPSKVWDIITNKQYAKILGNEFDKNAFVESDWKLNSKVYFKYEPNKLISTGTITKLTENKFIQVYYNFYGYEYVEKYAIEENNSVSTLSIHAGPYSSDFEAQKIVWQNWLSKVKELSEK